MLSTGNLTVEPDGIAQLPLFLNRPSLVCTPMFAGQLVRKMEDFAIWTVI